MPLKGFEHLAQQALSAVPPSHAMARRVDAFYRDRYSDDPTTVRKLAQHLDDGTANADWLRARRYRCTGSRVSAIVGENPYQTPDQLLCACLWDSFRGNAATQWGNTHECDAEAVYTAYLAGRVGECVDGDVLVGSTVESVGLVVDPYRPEFGMSPDGIATLLWCAATSVRTAVGSDPATLQRSGERVLDQRLSPTDNEYHVRLYPEAAVRTERRLVEYKCPYSRRSLKSGGIYPLKRSVSGAQDLVPIPRYYQCQIQWGMGVLGNAALITAPHRTDFVSWVPTRLTGRSNGSVRHATDAGTIDLTTVLEVPRFVASMRAQARRFWRDRFVPAVVWKELGCLPVGDVVPPCVLEC